MRSRLQIILAVVSVALAACHHQAPPSEVRTHVRFSTGTPGAGFHPLGLALARAYETSLPRLDIDIAETAGSVSNVQAIQAGTADLGLAFADVAYIAYIGRLADERRPFDRLRGVAVLQLTPLHLVVRAGANIHDIADLRGRRVGVGPPGSGTALTAELVLKEFGFGPDAFHAEFLKFNDAAARLVAGTLDAMFVNGNYPAESVRIATKAGATLLPLRGPEVDRLRHDYPFLKLTKIPGDMYPGHPGPTHTIGVDSVLLCRSDLDEALVYHLTRRFFEALPALAQSQESLRLMDLEQAPATPVPLHEGAARYYRERELFR